MSESAKTHYDTLGLKIDASFAEIKSQYRKLLLQVKLCYSTILVYLFTQTDEKVESYFFYNLLTSTHVIELFINIQ